MRNILILLLLVCTGVYAQDTQNIDADTAKVAKSGYNRISIKTGKLFFRGLTGTKKEVVSTNNSYANPSWIPSLALAKVTGLQDSLSNTVKYALAENVKNYYISCWGDSFTAGAGSSPSLTNAYPIRLTNISGVNTFNFGVGGETSSQILTRFLANSTRWSDAQIIWSGRNNGTNITQVLADIASMVSNINHNRYFILSIMNSSAEIIGSSDYNNIASLNLQLANIYGSKFIDIRKIIINNYNPSLSQDVIDFNNNVPPTSLRADALHLNNAGYEIVAQEINKKIKNLFTSPNFGAVSNQILNYSFKNPPAIGTDIRNDISSKSLTIQNYGVPNDNYFKILGGGNYPAIQGFINSSNSVLKLHSSAGLASYKTWRLTNTATTGNFVFDYGLGSAIDGETFTSKYYFTPEGFGINAFQSNTDFYINNSTFSTTAERKAIRIERNTSGGGGGAAIQFGMFNSSSTTNAEIAAVRTGGSYSTDLRFRTTDGGESNAIDRMTLKSNGTLLLSTSTSASGSASLDIQSITKGVLLPRMTTTQRDAITSPAEGLEIYNLTTHTKDFYNGTVWKTITTN